jgi:hypothetical protein
MRNLTRIQILALAIGFGVAACARPSVDATPSPAAETPATLSTRPVDLTCSPPQHVCVGCTGTVFCANRCPECAPIDLAPRPAQTAAAACRPPFRLCTDCSGGLICSIQCPACPPPAAPHSGPGTATLAVAPAAEACSGLFL